AERAQECGEEAVAQAAEGRHLRARAEAGAEDDVGVFLEGDAAHGGEVDRVAGAVGAEKADERAGGLGEAFLDGGAIAAVGLEDDDTDAGDATGERSGAVGGAVADDDDLHAAEAGGALDGRARLQAASDSAG